MNFSLTPAFKVLWPILLGLQLIYCVPVQAQTAYPTRVNTIATDVRWSLASLYSVWEKFQDERDELHAPKRSTDVAALAKTHNQTKATLLATMTKLDANAARLRAISPVPLTWKKWDNKLSIKNVYQKPEGFEPKLVR